MLTLRKASERGHADHGWLDTWHTFSFADYYDPAHHNFRVLRVMNDDKVAAGQGFGTHPHRDMEIITYVLEGELAHKDSMGHQATLTPGEVQRITAGTGIQHSEFNPSATQPVHLYQIWIVPDAKGHTPSYAQKAFPKEGRTGRWQTIVSKDGRDGSITIHQDAVIQLAELANGQTIKHSFAPERYGWLQLLRGQATVNGIPMAAGDGLAISVEKEIDVTAQGSADVMFFDLP
jgi:redox-sensitive bicupin YhaK (pirin superfamily)